MPLRCHSAGRRSEDRMLSYSGSQLRTLIVFLKDFFEKVNFEKNQQMAAYKHEILPSMQRVKHESSKFPNLRLSEVNLSSWISVIMRGSRGGDRGSDPLITKNIGFLSSTGPDPLKITKLPSQHSMLGHHGVSLAGRWWLTYSSHCFFSPYQLKINIGVMDHIWENFLDLHMGVTTFVSIFCWAGPMFTAMIACITLIQHYKISLFTCVWSQIICCFILFV